jgi:hypothetical protein
MEKMDINAYRYNLYKDRGKRDDYSDNFYKELNMLSLGQYYESASKDFDDFRAFFKLNHCTIEIIR